MTSNTTTLIESEVEKTEHDIEYVVGNHELVADLQFEVKKILRAALYRVATHTAEIARQEEREKNLHLAQEIWAEKGGSSLLELIVDLSPTHSPKEV